MHFFLLKFGEQLCRNMIGLRVYEMLINWEDCSVTGEMVAEKDYFGSLSCIK